MRVMNYHEAISELQGLTKFGINLGLERITSLLAYLGNPQEKIRCIHIGGTNGKGSVVSMLASILQTAGYRVGAFTSPHLVSYVERYTINGLPIAEVEFARYLAEVLEYYEKVRQEIGEAPTEFEVLTAMAFLYFAREKVDVLLLEVGLGGDIDSTNVISKPLLSIITNVSLDHCAYLGDTVQDIAEKKSGIVKEGCPVITASTDPDALETIRQVATRKKAPLYEVYAESSWSLIEVTPEGQYLKLDSVGNLFLPLQGEHQLVNAATAVLAVDVLNTGVFRITEDALKKGLSSVSWPGRLEKLNDSPDLYIDGAHNPAGLEALASWLLRSRSRYSRVILIIGMLDDKDQSAVSLLEPYTDMVIVTRPFSARAENWDLLTEYFQQQAKVILLLNEPTEAVQKALDLASATDLILVTGSLYLIGQIRQMFQC